MGDNQDTWPAGQTATMNVTYTQANAAGGAVVCEVSPGAGNEFILEGFHAICSGTNGILGTTETVAGANATTGAIQLLGSAASVATAALFMGGTSSGAGSTLTTATPYIIVSGTQALRIAETGAGAQNDTFQVLVNIRVKTGQMPSVTHANSTNAANVSVTAGAESFTTV